MSYVINKLAKVAPARKPIEDGEYTAKISRFEEPEGKNPYIVFTLEDRRELRYYINSDASVEIIQSNLNRQLDIVPDDDMTWDSWFESIKGSEVTLWVLTSAGTDKDGNAVEYHNVTPYKPAMFDAQLNGLL